jgi:hypothetical protein
MRFNRFINLDEEISRVGREIALIGRELAFIKANRKINPPVGPGIAIVDHYADYLRQERRRLYAERKLLRAA